MLYRLNEKIAVNRTCCKISIAYFLSLPLPYSFYGKKNYW